MVGYELSAGGKGGIGRIEVCNERSQGVRFGVIEGDVLCVDNWIVCLTERISTNIVT